MPDLTYIANQDGSIIAKIEGQDVKFVKESDLLAVKGGSESYKTAAEAEKTGLMTELAEANRLKGEEHNTVLQERTAKEQAEEKAKVADTLTTRVSELETENADHKTAREKLEEELLGKTRTILTTIYGVSEDTLKDKDKDQLRNLEEASKVLGKKGGPANFDTKGAGVGGGPTPGTSPIEQAKLELAAAKEQQRKRRSGDPDYNPTGV